LDIPPVGCIQVSVSLWRDRCDGSNSIGNQSRFKEDEVSRDCGGTVDIARNVPKGRLPLSQKGAKAVQKTYIQAQYFPWIKNQGLGQDLCERTDLLAESTSLSFWTRKSSGVHESELFFSRASVMKTRTSRSISLTSTDAALFSYISPRSSGVSFLSGSRVPFSFRRASSQHISSSVSFLMYQRKSYQSRPLTRLFPQLRCVIASIFPAKDEGRVHKRAE